MGGGGAWRVGEVWNQGVSSIRGEDSCALRTVNRRIAAPSSRTGRKRLSGRKCCFSSYWSCAMAVSMVW